MIGHFGSKIQNDRAASRSKRATKMIEVENFCHTKIIVHSHTSHPHNYYAFVTHRHSRIRVGQLVCGRFSNVLNKLWVLLLCFEQLLNKFESGFCGSSAWGLHALIELGTSTALRMEGRIGSRGFSVTLPLVSTIVALLRPTALTVYAAGVWLHIKTVTSECPKRFVSWHLPVVVRIGNYWGFESSTVCRRTKLICLLERTH